jgi:hypothetical protein
MDGGRCRNIVRALDAAVPLYCSTERCSQKASKWRSMMTTSNAPSALPSGMVDFAHRMFDAAREGNECRAASSRQ